jgi:hypothetical protein
VCVIVLVAFDVRELGLESAGSRSNVVQISIREVPVGS